MRDLFFVTLAFLLFTGCEKPLKDVMDYYPKVVTESVTVQADGSVRCVGRISFTGATDIVAAGFCASTQPIPQMLDLQGLAEINGDRFEVVYENFPTTGTYYFRAFATNDDGYSYGNVLSLSDITAEPITPPCTPPLNNVVLGGGLNPENYYPGQIFTVQQTMGNYQFQANTSAHNFTYRFGSELRTRTFTTTSSTDPEPGQVRIGFFSGITSGSMLPGNTVYVNEITPTQWEITVCSVPWGSNGRNLTTHFRVSA